MSRERATRVGVISLGCAKNLVDTEVMLGHLDRSGCTFVQDPAQADVILVNTCSFIDPAREESVQTILEAAELKKSGRLRRLVVAGCLVQRHADELRESLPEVDAFIGLDQLDRIGEAVAGSPAVARARGAVSGGGALRVVGQRSRRAAPTAVAAWGPSAYLYDHTTPRRRATPRHSAYVKIAEGCDHTCAFCAIPSFRGGFRSRDPGSLLQEVRALVERGAQEINLIAQDSSHYGRDLGLTAGLAGLLETLDRVPGLRWLRVHYLYPNTITDGLIETMARLQRVVAYVDLPLQHASADTLRRMRRGGDADSHRRLLDRFRRAMPDVTLRSTFIVGFPGETEDEFQALLEFVRGVRFDHLGVFKYSHEEGTRALALVDDVPSEVKQARYDALMACQREIVYARNAALVGRQVPVLVDGVHSETEHLLVGRMPSQAPDVDGQVLLNDGRAAPGDLVQVELTEAAGYDLVGRIVGPLA